MSKNKTLNESTKGQTSNSVGVDLYRICWKSNFTGLEGKGEPQTKEISDANLEDARRLYPTYLKHWQEIVKVEGNKTVEIPNNIGVVAPALGYVAKSAYWEKRCLAVEKFVDKSPGDSDIHEEQIEAYQKWQEIKRQEEPAT